MSTNEMEKQLNENIQYLNGRVDALAALLLGVANHTLQREEFRRESLERLDRLETTLLNQATPEARLKAIADTRKWLEVLTG